MNEEPLSVIVLSFHSCIRVIKETIALKDLVSMVHVCSYFANPESGTIPDYTAQYHNSNQLRAKLQRYENVDLIHVHNEPDWLVPIAREMFPNVPIVYDVHDLASLQDACLDREHRLEEEAAAIKIADGFIFVSDGYRDKTVKKYGIDRPTMVLHSYCNRDFIIEDRLPRIRGIGYEGGLSGARPQPQFAHRDHTYLARYCTANNIPIAFYGAAAPVMPEYLNLGAMVYPVMNYVTMLRHLSRHDWCFVGYAEPTLTLEHSMPNKMFESIAAGVPVLVCNAPEAGKWAEDNGFGVHINSVHEIPEVYDRHEELRKNVLARRKDFVMENHAEEIVKFYRRVIDARKA